MQPMYYHKRVFPPCNRYHLNPHHHLVQYDRAFRKDWLFDDLMQRIDYGWDFSQDDLWSANQSLVEAYKSILLLITLHSECSYRTNFFLYPFQIYIERWSHDTVRYIISNKHLNWSPSTVFGLGPIFKVNV